MTPPLHRRVYGPIIDSNLMKPLILWARDKYPVPYQLRIGAKTDDTVSGSVKIDDRWLPFCFDRSDLVITVGEGVETRSVQINEWGWEQ